MPSSETTPLVPHKPTHQEEIVQEVLESGIAVDPNASAFTNVVPGEEGGVPANEEPSEPAVTEEPLRSDLFIILGGMWVGTFLSALDGTIVATILSVIGSEFSVSDSIAWLGTSYLLTQTAFQPLYGRFSDIFGRKSATMFASIVFLLGSLFCGFSKTYTQLVLSRAFAGIGGGGLTTMSSIVTSDLVPLRKRGVYQGLGNLVYAVGAAIGGPLGGILSDSGFGWRYAFIIQVPICLIHSAIVYAKVDIPSGPGDIATKLKRIDFAGSVLLVLSVALVLTGLATGGNQLPWSSPLVLGSIILGLALVAAFVYVEKYLVKEPVLAPRILFSRTPGFVSLTNWFSSMSQFAIIYQVPLYFSAVQETTTSYAGLHLIPNAVFASAMSMLAGIYMVRTGEYRKLLIAFGALAVIGPLMMITWSQSTSETYYWITMVPGGSGYGGIITVTLIALISAVDPGDMAASTGVSYLFRATGSVLGISVSTALLQNFLKIELGKVITGPGAEEIIAKIRADVEYIRELPAELHADAILAFAAAMRYVFIGIALVAFFAFLCILPIPQHHLANTVSRKK